MLELDGVHKKFGSRTIVANLTARVDAGSALALIGPSGSGKTTMLRLIAGLETVDAGKISIGGRSVSSRSVHELPETRGIGMVFQDFALWPHMRAEKHLEFVLRGRGIARAERLDRAREMLSWLQLEHCAKSYPGTMSGGEQQRLALARALVTQPRLLLLDEPFSNLNNALRELIVAELLRRMREEKAAVVLATHNPSDPIHLNATEMEFT
ncbi:MAG: ATP-binding cassette domain-containing protein [Candidatus Hydrogenedentes bacterium]|nr:ATP-binding cassette domain-containing protein [Candidatus Hydrogenedentota bacterium]